MEIHRRITSIAHDVFTPAASSPAEIREELECHIELRTLENIKSGMAPEEARADAESKFGDFERNVQSCHAASLGLRQWLGHVAVTLISLLLVGIVVLSISFVRMHSSYQSEILSLKTQIRNQNVASAFPVQSSVQPVVAQMPIIAWQPPIGESYPIKSWDGDHPQTLESPWSDWSVLDPSNCRQSNKHND